MYYSYQHADYSREIRRRERKGGLEDFIDMLASKDGTVERKVNDFSEVKPIVEEAFISLTGRELPGWSIRVLPPEGWFDLQNQLFGTFNPGLLGFALREGKVYALGRSKADTVSVIGHELGHLLTDGKHDPVTEEAKAFAFARAWNSEIRRKDIGGLRYGFVNFSPAQNGVHDTAYDFIRNTTWNQDPMEVFWSISAGISSPNFRKL